MKIGIFGDSYAADNKMNPTDSWVDVLRHSHEVENHAQEGSALYFSIRKLKEHYQKYEKIIFVVTQPSRIKLGRHIPHANPKELNISHWPHIKHLIKDANSRGIFKGPLIDAYEAAMGYYTYIQDNDYDDYVQTLMIEDILKIHHDIMLIPSFTTSIPNKMHNGLVQIREKENLAWGCGYFMPDDIYDTRNCHMTKENNLILAEKILDNFNSNFLDLNLDDFVAPPDKDFYLKKHE